MELPEYYQLVNKALQGDREAQKKWGECQAEMIPKHIEFHSGNKPAAKDKAAKEAKKAAAEVKMKADKEAKEADKAAKKAEKAEKAADNEKNS